MEKKVWQSMIPDQVDTDQLTAEETTYTKLFGPPPHFYRVGSPVEVLGPVVKPVKNFSQDFGLDVFGGLKPGRPSSREDKNSAKILVKE